jgi:hypothetical protein
MSNNVVNAFIVIFLKRYFILNVDLKPFVYVVLKILSPKNIFQESVQRPLSYPSAPLSASQRLSVTLQRLSATLSAPLLPSSACLRESKLLWASLERRIGESPLLAFRIYSDSECCMAWPSSVSVTERR